MGLVIGGMETAVFCYTAHIIAWLFQSQQMRRRALTSLKYKQYFYDEVTQTWIREKRYFLPLIIVRIGLFLFPESLLLYFLRRNPDNFRGDLEGITLKQSVRVIYEILHEIAASKELQQNQIIYEDKGANQKHIFLVE